MLNKDIAFDPDRAAPRIQITAGSKGRLPVLGAIDPPLFIEISGAGYLPTKDQGFDLLTG